MIERNIYTETYNVIETGMTVSKNFMARSMGAALDYAEVYLREEEGYGELVAIEWQGKILVNPNDTNY